MDPYRSKPSVAFMPSASNATFHGGNYTVAGVINDHHTNQINLSGITPMELLLAHCALDALVNSNERYDPPKCAPHTRDPVMEKIITWTNKPYRGPSVLWLSGSAGAGKTAICQTVAEQFLMKRLLLGSFFFSRTGATSESGRSDGDRLIPTLVYQLFQAFPETKQFIEEEIRRDPALLHKSRQYQMAVLFENSLTSFSWRKAMRQIFGKKVRLIVIDGLDECQDTSVQRDLLRIISSTATNLSLPLRFLIASRPEGHITQSFKRYFKGVDIHHIQLDDEPSARIGIMTFLQDGFRDIHEHHPLQQNLETSWPGESVLSLLADKSSPQFVYASTVMKYVQSTKHLPSARLDAILNISYPPQPYTEDDPFDELDRLYRFIFSGIEGRDRPTVNCCLSIIYLAGREDFTVPLPTPSLFEGLFGLHPGGARIMLEPLLAVLAVPSEPDTPVQSHHAHLFEFLLNPHRSGTSVLDLTIANTLILKHYCSSPFSEYLGEASLFALKGMIHHAEMICITPDSRGFVDRLFVALFSKVLWYTQDQGIVEKFEILDDAFTILSQIQVHFKTFILHI
ncbi:hypothetical protein CPB83DRAFT_591957 [Crepidotus variabilis]|uniref:Nephrocystin 3-like N-terminal domain-containing protein n=1 Tax=Crepidotus variabilis TaxID=179855 RepID=A0A9P6EPX5_9AGAR|nr:hypothetical protein CPB83DRAFT_591957 [Crepidotus variabilis]